jgi:HEAT repeat protein
LNDHDLTVRLAAIRSLGHLTDNGSLKQLKRLLNHDAELVRAAAVSSLVERGQIDTLLEAADDSAWHVRVAVARLLADHRQERTDALAAKLLVDASPHVQQQMVASLAHWPLEQAGPLLLSAMGSSGFLVRKTARDELAKRWPAAAEFSTDAPADSRTARLAALRQRWQAAFGAVSEVAAAARQADTSPDTPKIAALLNELQAFDLDVRRRAADRLAQQTVKTPLSAEAAETLCRCVIADPDALVWRGALSALTGNTGDAATRLVYAGLSHPAAEVRRRACEHLKHHPDPRHHDVLIKSLEDADSEVIRTALHALAKSGAEVEPAPVERLLAASDKTLRVDAAECLVQLGAAGGDAALERLALDSDPAIRRQAAAAMGRSGDAALLPALMRLLDDQGGVRQTALASLAQVAGKDVARLDQAEPPPNSIEEVRRWREWFESRK